MTVTDELAAALVVARELWPNKSRSAQVSLLAQRGAQALVGSQLAIGIERRRAIEAMNLDFTELSKNLTIKKARKVWER